MESQTTIKIFRCRKCGVEIGELQGEYLIVNGLPQLLAGGITCANCGAQLVRHPKPKPRNAAITERPNVTLSKRKRFNKFDKTINEAWKKLKTGE